MPAEQEGLLGLQCGYRNVMTGTNRQITVTVKAFATLREVMDAEIRMNFEEGATIRALLARLGGRYGGFSGRVFDSPGTLRDFVNILRNGRNIQFLAGLDTPLADGDVIAIFPPLAGG